MTCGSYSYVFFDVNFVAHLKRVDASCELLDLFAECANAECVIKGDQYAMAPCNHFNPRCHDLDKIFSDETAVKIKREATEIGIDFSRISRDPADPKIFLWAYKTGHSAVWTCDKNLLNLCRTYDIPRSCFKAAVSALDELLDGAITEDSHYNTAIMKHGDDPFFHYDNMKLCDSHCGRTGNCSCA